MVPRILVVEVGRNTFYGHSTDFQAAGWIMASPCTQTNGYQRLANFLCFVIYDTSCLSPTCVTSLEDGCWCVFSSRDYHSTFKTAKIKGKEPVSIRPWTSLDLLSRTFPTFTMSVDSILILFSPHRDQETVDCRNKL